MSVIDLKTYKQLRDLLTISERVCEKVGVERAELIGEFIGDIIDRLDSDERTDVLEYLYRQYFDSPFTEDIDPLP